MEWRWLPWSGIAGVVMANAEDNRYGKQKVVYHINYPGGDGGKKYHGALRNIQNHINAVGKDNLEVTVRDAWQRAGLVDAGQG